jgi:hypothetical protein
LSAVRRPLRSRMPIANKRRADGHTGNHELGARPSPRKRRDSHRHHESSVRPAPESIGATQTHHCRGHRPPLAAPQHPGRLSRRAIASCAWASFVAGLVARSAPTAPSPVSSDTRAMRSGRLRDTRHKSEGRSFVARSALRTHPRGFGAVALAGFARIPCPAVPDHSNQISIS